MSEHTPGDWMAWENPYRASPVRGFDVMDGKGGQVAQYCTKPDARLIAAAPDMLEVLKMVVGFGDIWDRRYSMSIYDIDDIIEAARASIAKVEGME